MYITWKIETVPYYENGYNNADIETVTNYYQPQLRMNIGTGKDSFAFKIDNFNNNYGNTFKPKDKIIISRVSNTTTVSTDDIKMVGTIAAIPETNNHTNDLIRITGYNYSESLMNALVFVDPISSGFTIPQLIQQALISVQATNDSFAVTWHPDNPTLKKDDVSSFPLIKERFYYKTAKEIIEKYSTNKYTEDGNYYWYIDNNNRFIWRPNLSNVSYTFESSTDTYKEYKISKDTKDVKNFVIVKGGVDPQGKPIQVKYQDFSSSSKHGLRYKLLIDENKLAQNRIADDMIEAGISVGITAEDVKQYGNLPSNIPGFSYPFTFTWDDVETSIRAYCLSESDYVNKLRKNIKAELLKMGKSYVDDNSFGKLKIDITFLAGSKEWGLGDVVNIKIPNTTIDSDTTVPKDMRVMEIQFSETTDTFSLEEDVGTI